jgi:S-adenosylmethionine:tRNA ribosyltransferase-isomerase
MNLSEFDFDLPSELIAQHPLPEREASRMLLLEHAAGTYQDHSFTELPSMLRGDEVMVVNNTKVIPARLFGHRLGVRAEPVGKQGPAAQEYLRSRIEVMLVRRLEPNLWEALVRPGKKLRTRERIVFEGGELEAEVVERESYGLRRLRFSGAADATAAIERIGHVPLPPYIRRADEPSDRERYQTIFASQPGAVAAPTAGLHFTPAIVAQLKKRGIEFREITLEVGLGTFQPIHGEDIDQHRIHSEAYEIPEETVAAITAARRDRRAILAVGTTVVRALEDAAQKSMARGGPPGAISPGRADAEIFIRPGHRFAVVDQLLTNFHLPRSTLLVLVAAFAGRELTLAAYGHAVADNYRFYSYGDCMLIR